MKQGSGKIYQDVDVYTAACGRIRRIFDDFPTVAVAFSGGKDSGVLLNLCIDEARKRRRRVAVLFIDLEAFYKMTVDFVERMITNNSDVVDPYWVGSGEKGHLGTADAGVPVCH